MSSIQYLSTTLIPVLEESTRRRTAPGTLAKARELRDMPVSDMGVPSPGIFLGSMCSKQTRSTSDVGHDCELCYWAKVFEGTMKHERRQRLQLHEKLLNHIAYPHGPCDLCNDAASISSSHSSSHKGDGDVRREREKVWETAGLAKSQLQDIHEMKMVAGMVQWLWEAEVKGLG
ncbi:MAG: hypothetical protein M1821_007548 [Bathelium mastoideum]|nr:MAG: hypothetical protein M1821_007548 [Bathelium mastoideum]KAI9695051.1 MAG: hypothetical protein M1822_000668 [Bathelium mastoideum]